MKTILVTGSSGFIGSRLIKALNPSYRVIGLSRKKLPDQASQIICGEFHSLDDLKQLDSLKIDVLVHLGAEIGGCEEDAGLYVNVLGTRRLVRYLIDRNCRKFVMASSIAAVGCLGANFIPRQLPIPDDHPCLADDAYGLSKALMEEVTSYFARRHSDCDFINFRIGAVINEDTWHPEPIRTIESHAFLYLAHVMISDVLDALKGAIESPVKPGSRVFNLVGPDACCDAPVAEILHQTLGAKANTLDLSFFEKKGREFDAIYKMDAIRQALGFIPKKSVRPLKFLSDKKMEVSYAK